MAETMRAVTFDGHGGVEVLRISDVPRPVAGPGELLVRVRSAALNHADTLQRKGEYSAPPGESAIPGVEIAGEVEAWHPELSGFSRGDRVCGIVGSGGYAEYCRLDAGMAVPVPEGWSFVDAAATPEVFYTADTTLFELGGLAAGQTVLIHAAGSGVGTACIQLAREVGATIVATAGADEKLERCRALGAHLGINYKRQDFAAEVQRFTGGRGVDVIEDFVGTDYLAKNLSVLKDGGSLVLVGILGSLEPATVDLLPLILRRLQIKGSSMRPRPLADKRAITATFRRRWLPLLVEGRLQPVIDSVFPWEQVAEAHRRMDENRNFGKILLTLD